MIWLLLRGLSPAKDDPTVKQWVDPKFWVRPGGVFFSILWIFSCWKFLEKKVSAESTGRGPPPSPSSLNMPDSGAQRLSVIPTEGLSRHHTCWMRGPSGPHFLQELFSWSVSHKFLLIELYSLLLTCQLYVSLKSRLMTYVNTVSHIFQSPD